MSRRGCQVRRAFDDMALGTSTVFEQGCVHLQTTAHSTPMRPDSGLKLDPLQPVQHAARHFFVQPRRNAWRAALPALNGNRV